MNEFYNALIILSKNLQILFQTTYLYPTLHFHVCGAI